MSAWDVTLAGATQRDLIIRYRQPGNPETTGELIVDDLQVAQFVRLLLSNSNLRAVIDTLRHECEAQDPLLAWVVEREKTENRHHD